MEKKKILIILGIILALLIIGIILFFALRKPKDLTASLSLIDDKSKYEWTYDIYDHSILEFFSIDTQSEMKDDEQIDTLTYTFKGVSDGTTRIRFEYKNPKRKDVKPIKTIIYEATVVKNKVTLEKVDEKENLYNK